MSLTIFTTCTLFIMGLSGYQHDIDEKRMHAIEVIPPEEAKKILIVCANNTITCNQLITSYIENTK